MRCKHADQVLIHEEYIATITHYIEDGKCVLAPIPGSGNYPSKLHFHCTKCGTMRTYNKRVSLAGFRRLPKWIRESAEAARILFVIVRQ